MFELMQRSPLWGSDVKTCLADSSRGRRSPLRKDMNKLNVGTLAVSRYYHQLRHFFPLSDRPCYPGHDIPSRNSKIIPCGYMLLLPKGKQEQQRRTRSRSLTRPQHSQQKPTRSHSESPERKPKVEEGCFTVDKLQRLHWTVPSTGPLHVFNRSTKFFKATSTEHASDLFQLFNEVPAAMKGVVNFQVDGGPDFGPKNMMNFVSYGQLWKACDIDCLMVTTHAPGHSAYNKIEHAWAPLSRALAGVTLPNALPGQLPPEQQPGLVGEELQKELAAVFDGAADIPGGYWNNLHYGGWPVVSRKVPCLNPDLKYTNHEVVEF